MYSAETPLPPWSVVSSQVKKRHILLSESLYTRMSSVVEKENRKEGGVYDDLDAELEKLLLTPPLEGLTDAEVQVRIAMFGTNSKF
jgi:hypothetical protein